ncbi:e3 ubiquitin-protein ligase upl6 [Nicotiana attenuata]|uniref:E3 ubiquitin-protein ligase upl6 n=1 Tax=Nicotiana attenuata TaxID=49451 RepID=A0A314KHV0_NICAT|nr:e3 ubiquitin-protein ligase upl6 [Nicotiana attenuata]
MLFASSCLVLCFLYLYVTVSSIFALFDSRSFGYVLKCFRGRKVVEAERSKVRENFLKTYGDRCHRVDRQCFGPDSDFLCQLLFFFNPTYTTDVSILVETCRSLLELVRDSGLFLLLCNFM